jgi:hypothetical protein
VNFGKLFSRAGKLVTDNSPLILTALGVTGTVTTAVLTAKGTFEAAEAIEDEKNSRLIRKTDAEGNPLPEFDNTAKAQLVWKCYIPAAGSLVMTVACIITANRIGVRRAAALAAAYSLAEKGWEEYKHKIVETIGATKEQKARDALVQDQVTKHPPTTETIIITGQGDVLCRDGYSGRYFESTVDKVNAAVNEVNFDVNSQGYASLSDFYYLIGLPRTDISEEVGWNGELMKIDWTAAVTEDMKPCMNFTFHVVPIREYHKFRD